MKVLVFNHIKDARSLLFGKQRYKRTTILELISLKNEDPRAVQQLWKNKDPKVEFKLWENRIS